MCLRMCTHVHMGAEVNVECLPQGLFLNQELPDLLGWLAN